MNGKIALVTGGSRGLGKDMALALAKKGVNVMLTYKTNKEDAEQVAVQITAMGVQAAVMQFDAGDIAGLGDFVQRAAFAVKEYMGKDKIDFLINNGGVGATIPFEKVTEEDFDRLTNIHLKGVYFLTQKLLPYLNDGGSIVNISSGTTRFCVPGYSVYSSLKAAIETFTKYLAKELGGKGIRANVVAPGPIETDFNNAAIRSNPEMKARLIAQTALGRAGGADDIGSVVAFLCSDEAKWINGQRIEVSGGINL